MEKLILSNQFDNLKYLSGAHQKYAFPEHYHDCYCITFVNEGIACVEIHDQKLLGAQGNFVLSNPYEVHANPIADKDQVAGFDTLYISPDCFDAFAPNKGVHLPSVIQNDCIAAAFQSFTRCLAQNDALQCAESCLKTLISQLSNESSDANGQDSLRTFIQLAEWDDFTAFVEENLEEKITLDDLAKNFYMDKFNFAKKFRCQTGMSPINFILYKKILAARNTIQPQSNLTTVAYQFGFSDLAHFSKTFTRYLGISPSSYQRALVLNN